MALCYIQSPNLQPLYALSVPLKTPLVGLASVKIEATKHPRNKEYQKSSRDHQKGRPPCVLPPHRPPQIPRTALEPERLLVQTIGLVDQQLDLFSPFQHLFDVLHHHSLHVLDLIFDCTQPIDVAPRAVVVVHPLLDHLTKLLVEAERDGPLGNVNPVLLSKKFVDINQIKKKTLEKAGWILRTDTRVTMNTLSASNRPLTLTKTATRRPPFLLVVIYGSS